MNKLFGTDGIRGTPGAYPLTDEMFSKIAQAVTLHTIGRKENKKKPRIVIGKDTRLSGHQIERNLAENLSSFGTDVFLAGIITTPGVSFLVKDLKADMGIMISASHNKAQDNGLKFFNAKGCKLSIAEEEKIEELIYTKEVTLGTVPPKANKFAIDYTDSRQLVIYWFRSGNLNTYSYLQQQFKFVSDRMMGKRTSGAMVRVSALVKDKKADAALALVKGFVGEIEPLLSKFVP